MRRGLLDPGNARCCACGAVRPIAAMIPITVAPGAMRCLDDNACWRRWRPWWVGLANWWRRLRDATR